MKAQDLTGKAPGGQRTRLADVLPLATPYVIQIFPVYACNFKCKYCIFSVDKARRGFISDTTLMDLALYHKCIDDMQQFPSKIKVLRFVGIGEPLLHKDIVKMVKYAADKGVADTIEILTNGALLTPALSDALIAAGLTRLVVSLQGTTEKKYKDISDAAIDMTAFVDNLRYFFMHKGKAKVYVKIIDCAIDGKDDEARFRSLFGDVCDSIAIEHAVPIHGGVDYDGVLKQEGTPVTQFGLPVKDVRVCPQPFFTMQVNPDGKVVPCYSFEYPGIMGDCRVQSLKEVWDSQVWRRFRCAMLKGVSHASGVCAHCNIIRYRLFPEDSLEGHEERLCKVYGC